MGSRIAADGLMYALRMRLEQSPRYKWIVVGMLWMVCLFNYADRQAIFSVFPPMKQQMGLSSFELGVVGASFMWVYALCGPFAGWACDRLPRKALVLGGLLFWSVATAATALAHGYGELVICRALTGLGEAFYFPASMSLIGDYHGAKTRSRAMAVHQSSVYAGSMMGGWASGYMGQFYGWRSSFVLFGGLGVGLGVLLWGLLREPVRGMVDVAAPEAVKAGMGAALREIFANRLVVLLMLVFVGANFVAVVFMTWMPTFLFEKFHMSLSMAGFHGTAYLQVASVFGVLSGGVLADAAVRRGGRWSLRGRMVTQAAGLLCGAPFLLLTGRTMATPVLIVAMIGFGYFKGIYDANIWASLYDVVPVERRGVAAGVMNSVGWLGAGVAPVAIAVAASRYGLSACLSATGAIYVAIGLLLLWGSWVGLKAKAEGEPLRG